MVSDGLWCALGDHIDERIDIVGLMDDAKNAADSDKGEKATDSGIEKTEKTVSEKTGGKHDEQIDKAGDAVDSKIGN